MIRKLRIKFIAISMTSTIIVLFLILGSINLLNYREMSHNADTILDFLKENDGELPENLYKSQHKKTNGISPETSFESRYFSVFLSNNRQRCEADTDNISAIDEETAIKYAQKINRSNKNCGFISKYRYMKENTSNGVKIYFLDCTKSMMSFQTFLVTSFLSLFLVLAPFLFWWCCFQNGQSSQWQKAMKNKNALSQMQDMRSRHRLRSLMQIHRS